MFVSLIALGTILLQVLTICFIVLWYTKSSLLKKIFEKSHLLLASVFIFSVFGSLVFEYSFGYEPCLLCWYQRIAIFGIAILSLTGDIRKNKTLQKQILAFSIIGVIVAIFHNYIDLVPGSADVCGTGVSCLKRYVHEFGYITIPMMSFSVLLFGVVISSFLRSYTQGSLEQKNIVVQ